MNKSLTILLIFLLSACTYQMKIKTGDQAFERKQYAVAQRLYRTEFDQTEDNGEKAFKAFRIAQCFNHVSNFEQALKWFKKAYDLNYGLKALEEYAFALKNNGEYEAAISAFQELTEELKTTEFRKEINICKLNIEWSHQQTEYFYLLKKIKTINEKGSEYSAVIDPAGNLYFVSDRLVENNSTKHKYNWTGRYFSDIFKYSNQQIVSFSKFINSDANEGSFCFDSKMTTIYFTRCGDIGETEDFCHIYKSELTDDSWTEPEILDFGFSQSNQIHPALHFSDSILVFSADAANGIGQFDLYMSHKTADGWSYPQNLGQLINTPFDEKFPVWYRDTLFLSSNGHPGMGGLDVFKTYILGDESWAPPVNLKPNINSSADDFGFYVDTSFHVNDSIMLRALLTSNREQTDNDEIYSVELRKRSSAGSSKEKVKYNWEVLATIEFVQHEKYKNHQKVLLDSVTLVEKVSKNSVFSANQHAITLKVLAGDQYTFLASKRNFLNAEFSFTTPSPPKLTHDSIHSIRIEVELLPVLYEEEFILQELYYDFDDWKIRPDAIPALERLKTILTINPKIEILLGSHTDCRGEEIYNDELSTKRAHAALEWLVNNGISPERLQFLGYGEREPSIPCKCEDCTDQQHQANRRTTFKILR